MEINFKEIKFKTKLANDKERPDLLAYIWLTLIDGHGRSLTIGGFTLRKSKFNGKPYLVPPSKSTPVGFYKFVLIERTLWREIEKEAISQYDYEIIPIIEEKKR